MSDALFGTPRLVAQRPTEGAPSRRRRLGRSEALLLVATAVGLLHHVDHVLRVDHSGWPFRPEVTPFTFSLLAYPVALTVLLLRRRPWFRVGLMAVVFLATQAGHLLVETPHDQYATWAHGASADPATHGTPNLLGVASPAIGFLAAGWSILLSVVLVLATVSLVADARRGSGRRATP